MGLALFIIFAILAGWTLVGGYFMGLYGLPGLIPFHLYNLIESILSAAFLLFIGGSLYRLNANKKGRRR